MRLRDLPTDVITESGLMELACHWPLHVIEEGGKYYCIGGLKLFRLMQYGLPCDRLIPVLLYDTFTAKKLRAHMLFDLFVVPVLASIDRHDLKPMGGVWEKFEAEELFTTDFDRKSSEALNALLHCDPRTAKKVKNGSRSAKSK